MMNVLSLSTLPRYCTEAFEKQMQKKTKTTCFRSLVGFILASLNPSWRQDLSHLLNEFLFSRDEQDRASQLSFDIYSFISVSNNTVLTRESVRILEHTLIQTYHNSLTIFKTVPTTSRQERCQSALNSRVICHNLFSLTDLMKPTRSTR